MTFSMSSEIINNTSDLTYKSKEDVNSSKYITCDVNDDDKLKTVEIINAINDDMPHEISSESVVPSTSISIPVISTPKVSFSNPSRIRIINSNDFIGKTLLNKGNMTKVISVPTSATGVSKDFIKIISGKTIRNMFPVTGPMGPSPAKIIRIKPENESPQKINLSSANPNAKKFITIQNTNTITKNPIHVHLNKNSVNLSPKTVSVINKTTVTSSNLSTVQTSSTQNYVLLTPSIPFVAKSIENSSSLLRPVACSDLKNSVFDRYDLSDLSNRRNTRIDSNSMSSSTWQQYVRQYAHMGPCPICEDSISGYHYGIFCCESCKGFFKRSVQNHKDYVCHMQQSGGEPCSINKHTRKKCPSCRFQRCVDKGMRIEAVRNDRSRGGRSLYPGSRNRIQRYSFVDSALLNEDAQKSPLSPFATTTTSDPTRYISYINQPNNSTTPVSQQQLTNTNFSFEFSRNSSLSNNGSLHRDLSSRGRTSMMSVLDNIVIIEEQLQQERDVLGTIMEDDEVAVYKVLLKLAEQRLHRMVRWSRALPEFSAIDTDDQIMLVQNCWAELLILDCCYRSLGDPREIHLTSGKCINLEAACELGAKEIVEFVLRTTQKLKHLKLDIREYACLKVLLLMQPDLKHLKAEGRVRMFQETINQLLLDYTNHSYEQELPNKFNDLLLCVSEIREASNSVKEMLISKDLNPFLSSNSLLLELLNCNVNNGNLTIPITTAQFEAGTTPLVTAVPSFKSGIMSKDVKIISISNRSQNTNLGNINCSIKLVDSESKDRKSNVS